MRVSSSHHIYKKRISDQKSAAIAWRTQQVKIKIDCRTVVQSTSTHQADFKDTLVTVRVTAASQNRSQSHTTFSRLFVFFFFCFFQYIKCDDVRARLHCSSIKSPIPKVCESILIYKTHIASQLVAGYRGATIYTFNLCVMWNRERARALVIAGQKAIILLSSSATGGSPALNSIRRNLLCRQRAFIGEEFKFTHQLHAIKFGHYERRYLLRCSLFGCLFVCFEPIEKCLRTFLRVAPNIFPSMAMVFQTNAAVPQTK